MTGTKKTHKKKSFKALSIKIDKEYEIKNIWDKYSKGENVSICVLDSGIPNHIDLIINIEKSKNFIEDEDGTDYYNHVTPVVGLLNSQLNYKEMNGLCPESEIICCKVLDKYGSGEEIDIINALKYCYKLKPDIINLSLGSNEFGSKAYEEILRTLKNNNIFVIAATGNDNNKLDYPASSKHTIAVGSINELFKKTDFSNFGNGIDYAVPGSDLYSTSINNKYSYFSGTSFSAPIFSGLLSLYISFLKKNNYNYTWDSVVEDLNFCSLDLGESGKDDLYGWGNINLNCLFSLENKPKIKKISFLRKILNKFKWIL